ncbi:MAG: hypothetical protein QNJ90_03790 [Planctomycetota bacterium]|nr:hypothetical protein [Planctomycetota bacterium]
MTPAHPARRPARSSSGLLLGLFLLVAAAGVLLTLHALEVVTLPFFATKEEEAVAEERRGPAPGRVRVPIAARAIAAYESIQRDDLWDRAAGRVATVDLSAEVVERRGILADARQIVGRVLDHEKAPGYVFTERDFLPRGTRPGLVAGIPPGKRALRFEAENVQGLVGLRPGDRFDLLASVAVEVEPDQLGALSKAGAAGAELELRARLAAQRRQGEIRVLVQNGVIVSPVTTRQIPVSTASLTRGMTTRTKPVQEVVIAVAPEELGPLSEALAIGATIMATPRSGHPDDPQDSVTPDYRSPWLLESNGEGGKKSPTSDFRMMEVLEDGKLKVVPVPAARKPAKGK